MELVSELNKMTIVFHANENVANARGLRVEYFFDSIQCGAVFTENNGTFDNVHASRVQGCKYIFEAPPGKYINLSFSAANLLQENFDEFIQLFGPGGKDNLLMKYVSTKLDKFKIVVLML